MTNRVEANREMLKILSELVEKHPYMRFSQILFAFNVVVLDPEHGMQSGGIPWKNEFYLESTELLARVNKVLESE